MTARCGDSRRQRIAALHQQKNTPRIFSARIFPNFFWHVSRRECVAARIAGARRANAARSRATLWRIDKMPVFSSDFAFSEISLAMHRAGARDARQPVRCAVPRCAARETPRFSR
jgi:hypothetical protein